MESEYRHIRLDKPKVAILDMDDTLAAFSSHWLPYAQEKIATFRAGEYWKPDPKEYHLETAIVNKYGNLGAKIVQDFYIQHKMRDLVPIEGSLETVRFLENLGFDFCVITGRPAWLYSEVKADTLAWLVKHNIKVKSLTFCRDKAEFLKYYKYLYKDHFVIALEDSADYANSLSYIANKVFLRNREHNLNQYITENVIRFNYFYEVNQNILDHLINYSQETGNLADLNAIY